jgi:hypothetical protein
LASDHSVWADRTAANHPGIIYNRSSEPTRWINVVSLNQDFQLTEATASIDQAGHASLGAQAVAGEYRILINPAGQILLDPIAHRPEPEQWLWQNPEAIAAVRQGIEQAKAGQVKDLGSFAAYADLEIDD